MRMKAVVVLLLVAASYIQGYAKDMKGCVYPDGMVPYHVHIELLEAISNLVERVSAIEARYRRVDEMRSAAKKRSAEKVSVRKRVNELNEILKKRYKEKKK